MEKYNRRMLWKHYTKKKMIAMCWTITDITSKNNMACQTFFIGFYFMVDLIIGS